MYTSQYTVKMGECPVCEAERSLMVTDRKPLEWGYCTECRLSRSLHHLNKNSYKGSSTSLLWQFQEHCISSLDTHTLDSALLGRLGMPRNSEDPLNRYFFKDFLGYTHLSTLRYILKERNIRCVSIGGLNKDQEVLCVALQSSPGFVIGFYLLLPDAADDIIVRTYKHKDETAYFYPHLYSSYICRTYADLDEYRYDAAMAVVMGGGFNAIIEA
jgi:hypothetical protein